MKRISLILLTLVYVFSSVGVSAKSMYCMGLLRSTTISYAEKAPKKAGCKMATRIKNCCKTKKQLLKVKDQHTYSAAFELLAKLFPVLLNFTNNDEPQCAAVTLPQQLYYGHAPPVSPKTPVYILNCTYRI
jgi:hypothetical protein